MTATMISKPEWFKAVQRWIYSFTASDPRDIETDLVDLRERRQFHASRGDDTRDLDRLITALEKTLQRVKDAEPGKR